MVLTRAESGGYLITECGPGFFFHCKGFVLFQFCSYVVTGYVLASGRWKAGMGAEARTTNICTNILLITEDMKPGSEDLAYWKSVNLKAVLYLCFHAPLRKWYFPLPFVDRIFPPLV